MDVTGHGSEKPFWWQVDPYTRDKSHVRVSATDDDDEWTRGSNGGKVPYRPEQLTMQCRSCVEAKSNCLCIIWTSSCGTTYALQPFPWSLSHILDGCTKSESADYIVFLCLTVHRLPINHHVSGYNHPAWTRTRLCCSATDGIRFAFYSSSCRGREHCSPDGRVNRRNSWKERWKFSSGWTSQGKMTYQGALTRL